MHSCPCLSSHALCNNYFHVLAQCVSGRALSQGSSYHTSYAPVVWVSHWSVWHLRTCCLNLVINSFSKPKLCHWRLLFFFPSVFPENQKQQHKKGTGRKRKEETSSALLRNCHSYKILLSSSLLPTLLLKALEAGIKMDTAFLQHWPRENSDLFRYTVQSIFPSIPFRFASDPVCSVPAVFPQVSNITETKKISPSPAAVTQQAETIHSLWTRRRLRFSSQIQRSMCYFLCFNQFRMREAAGGRGEEAGRTLQPGQDSPGTVRCTFLRAARAPAGARYRLYTLLCFRPWSQPIPCIRNGRL